ncbi:MAG: potassium/proton antiporter [Betaproteobacteria bacterium]
MFIDLVNQWLLLGALIALVGLVLGALSSRRGVPFLLVFLVVGMLAGEDGPGGIEFDDHRLSFLIGNLALAVILLDGGLRTSVASFRVAFRPALALATVGVALTAALLALAARWLLGLDWVTALLLGAVVASTDAAAVFALLKASGARLNERVANTLEVESGVNDPMAVFMTITLIGLAAGTLEPTAFGLARMFVLQIGLGLALGALLGWLLAQLTERLHLNDGLTALLVCAGGVAIFAATNALGGSGFLAVYLAGVIVGNRAQRLSAAVLQSMDGLAWLAQAGMFLLLGLLVTPRDLLAVLAPAVAIAMLLMLVARPLACALCLAPFRFAPRETVFIGWVGLRGAVPIVLAIFPLLAHLPQAQLIFNVAFVVVLASLLLQGMTIAPAARRLGVVLPPRLEPALRAPFDAAGAQELTQFVLPSEHPWLGASAAQLELPEGTRLLAVARGGRVLEQASAGALQADDALWFVSAPTAVERLTDRFSAGQAPAGASAPLRFVLDGDVPLAEVMALYGLGSGAPPPPLTLAQALREHNARPVEGDSVQLQGFRLTVVEMDGERIAKVALTVG